MRSGGRDDDGAWRGRGVAWQAWQEAGRSGGAGSREQSLIVIGVPTYDAPRRTSRRRRRRTTRTRRRRREDEEEEAEEEEEEEEEGGGGGGG